MTTRNVLNNVVARLDINLPVTLLIRDSAGDLVAILVTDNHGHIRNTRLLIRVLLTVTVGVFPDLVPDGAALRSLGSGRGVNGRRYRLRDLLGLGRSGWHRLHDRGGLGLRFSYRFRGFRLGNRFRLTVARSRYGGRFRGRGRDLLRGRGRDHLRLSRSRCRSYRLCLRRNCSTRRGCCHRRCNRIRILSCCRDFSNRSRRHFRTIQIELIYSVIFSSSVGARARKENGVLKVVPAIVCRSSRIAGTVSHFLCDRDSCPIRDPRRTGVVNTLLAEDGWVLGS